MGYPNLELVQEVQRTFAGLKRFIDHGAKEIALELEGTEHRIALDRCREMLRQMERTQERLAQLCQVAQECDC